jgi:hypothetical protein
LRIIISHSRSKREISGAFQLCGSRADLLSLARQIIGHIAFADAREQERHHDDRVGFAFGWMDIMPTQPAPEALTNTPPKGWDD